MATSTRPNPTVVTPARNVHHLNTQHPAFRLSWAALLVLASVIVNIVIMRRMIRHDPGNISLLSSPTFREKVAVSVIVVLAVFTVQRTHFYERWMFWRKPCKEHALASIAGTLVALYVMVEMFTAVTSVAAQTHKIPMTGPFAMTYDQPAQQYPEALAEKGRIFEDSYVLLPGNLDVYQTNELFFGWTLLDAVPGLQLPTTLDLKEPAAHPTGWHGGLIVLTFKILVILPILTVARSLYERRGRNTSTGET